MGELSVVVLQPSKKGGGERKKGKAVMDGRK